LVPKCLLANSSGHSQSVFLFSTISSEWGRARVPYLRIRSRQCRWGRFGECISTSLATHILSQRRVEFTPPLRSGWSRVLVRLLPRRCGVAIMEYAFVRNGSINLLHHLLGPSDIDPRTVGLPRDIVHSGIGAQQDTSFGAPPQKLAVAELLVV